MGDTMNLTKSLSLALSLAVSAGASAMSKTPPPDPIADFQNSWAGQALAHQRSLDVDAPMSKNNILGTHNTYNSEVYRTPVRYIDPQQKHSIYDQLRIGARFIELDVHWTAQTHGAAWTWGPDLLLCHSGIGASMGDLHVGCSLTDRFATDGFKEVANFLNENPQEVIIMMIEDHTDGRHAELMADLNETLGGKIYASQGCKQIPDSLTRADVLAAGNQVVLMKSGGCANDAALSNLAFSGLGNINRVWEDRTMIGTVADFFDDGKVGRITAEDVVERFKNGGNIVNFDNMTYNDGRMEAGIWSWDVNQPDDYQGAQDCAVQWGNGRWDDDNCSVARHFACQNNTDGSWDISSWAGQWTEGSQACAELGDYSFAAPTNSQANEAVKAAKAGVSHVWLNASDRNQEGNWVAN